MHPPWYRMFEDANTLPGSLHEAFNGAQDLGVDTKDPDNHFARRRWRNYNAWSARMTRDRVCDLALHALWALVDALESKRDRRGNEYDRYRWTPKELAVAVAADWISIAGKVLWGHQKHYQ